MTQIKETIEVETQNAKVSAEEGIISIRSFIYGYSTIQRRLLYGLAIAIIPLSIAARVGAQKLTEYRLRSEIVVAHPPFTTIEQPTLSSVTVLRISGVSGIGQSVTYTAFTKIVNNNLDLAATTIPYTVDFYNSNREKIGSVTGHTFLLPNQIKYLVVPRFDTKEQVSQAKFILGQVQWQKKLSIPQVSIKAPSPIIYNEVNPLNLIVEGSIVNDSPYQLGTIRIVFVVYNTANQIVAVSQRDEFDVPAFGRRGYKQTWPQLYSDSVSKVEIFPDTNTLDGQNIKLEQTNK